MQSGGYAGRSALSPHGFFGATAFPDLGQPAGALVNHIARE